MHIYESHVGCGDCEILQNPIVKATEVPKMYRLSKRSGIYASLWLQIDRYGSRRLTTVAKSIMIHKENGRHVFEDRCAAEAR